MKKKKVSAKRRTYVRTNERERVLIYLYIYFIDVIYLCYMYIANNKYFFQLLLNLRKKQKI